jgi:hypothetical protein
VALATPIPQTEPNRRAYGAAEFAFMIGASERTVRKGIATGEIRTVRILGRVLIPDSEVERLLTPTPQMEGASDEA